MSAAAAVGGKVHHAAVPPSITATKIEARRSKGREFPRGDTRNMNQPTLRTVFVQSAARLILSTINCADSLVKEVRTLEIRSTARQGELTLSLNASEKPAHTASGRLPLITTCGLLIADQFTREGSDARSVALTERSAGARTRPGTAHLASRRGSTRPRPEGRDRRPGAPTQAAQRRTPRPFVARGALAWHCNGEGGI